MSSPVVTTSSTARAVEQPLLGVNAAELGLEVMSEIVADEGALGRWSQVLSKGHSVPSKEPAVRQARSQEKRIRKHGKQTTRK